jgi:hypothetical protein
VGNLIAKCNVRSGVSAKVSDYCVSKVTTTTNHLILFALLIQDRYEQCAYLQLVLPPSRKEYNYGIRIGQSSSSLTKFIANSINIYVSK